MCLCVCVCFNLRLIYKIKRLLVPMFPKLYGDFVVLRFNYDDYNSLHHE